MSSIPGQGTKIPHAVWSKKKNILKWIPKFLRSDEQVVKSASAGYQGHSQEFP